MSIISTMKMTARQFLELGEDPPETRLELINGEVAVSPSPIPSHSHTVVQLTLLLGRHVKSQSLGRIYTDVDTLFGEYDVRRPDLIFFSKSRLHLVGKKAMEGAPDLCVEVTSPSSGTIDRVDKFHQYAAGGVRFYWLVDPQKKTIEAYELADGSYRETARGQNEDVVRLPPFPDLEIPLADLWHPE